MHLASCCPRKWPADDPPIMTLKAHKCTHLVISAIVIQLEYFMFYFTGNDIKFKSWRVHTVTGSVL